MSAEVTRIAPGVRQVTVGGPARSQVYLLDDDPAGPIAFDAAIKGTGAAVLRAAGEPLSRVILSHAHADHRGGANELQAPVFCHPDDVADAEGDAGASYTRWELVRNEQVRAALPMLVTTQWDGGPVRIAGTVDEGDEVAGFQVVHLPGHSPGQIALFRESDRLMIAGDTVYTIDLETGGQPASARVPHPATNWDTTRAREAVRRLIDFRPSAVYTGHAGPLTGDVEAQLEAASTHRYD